MPITKRLSVIKFPQLYLKVLKATGEVQDVPEVSLGVPTGTRGLSLLQLLGDRVELQGPDGKDLAGPQELFSCNSRAPKGERPAPAPLGSQGLCPPGLQLTSTRQTPSGQSHGPELTLGTGQTQDA